MVKRFLVTFLMIIWPVHSAFSIDTSRPNSSPLEIGVGTHLAFGQVTWQLISSKLTELGVQSFRDDILWDHVEKQKGKYSTLGVANEMAHAMAFGAKSFRPLLIADYGNPYYDSNQHIFSPSGRSAYASYAKWVVETYGNRLPYLELWNEWNLGTGVKGNRRGTPDDYANLVKTTVPQIRSVGKPVKILIGATGDDLDDWSWTRSLFNQGVLAYADGYSVHMYNYMAGSNAIPEEMFERLERLQSILALANGGKPFPVYVTEIGWPTNLGKGGVSQELSGAYLSRFLLEASGYKWIKGVWIYDLLDDGDNSEDREHNFGLFDIKGNPKAGTCNVRKAVELINSLQFVNKGVTQQGYRWLQFESSRINRTVFIAFVPRKEEKIVARLKPTLEVQVTKLCDVNFTEASLPLTHLASELPLNEIPIVILVNRTGVKVEDVFAQ
jgi:hypothetical protein